MRLLKSGDRLQLDVFYTQRESALVDVRGIGKFADGDIRPARDTFRPWRVGITLSIFALFLIPLLIYTIDQWVFQMPMGIFHLADAFLDMHAWWLPTLGWSFWFLSGPEIRSWWLGYLRRLRRPADTHSATIDPYDAEPQTSNAGMSTGGNVDRPSSPSPN